MVVLPAVTVTRAYPVRRRPAGAAEAPAAAADAGAGAVTVTSYCPGGNATEYPPRASVCTVTELERPGFAKVSRAPASGVLRQAV